MKLLLLSALLALSGCSQYQTIKSEPYRDLPYHAPTTEIPPIGVKRISATQLKERMMNGNAPVLIDVYGAIFREESLDFDGAWLVSAPRESLPQSVWLPNVGKVTLNPVVQNYFDLHLKRLTSNDTEKAVVFFCIEDCWMAWNASKRAHEWGYKNVYWFREGTDGWKDNNWPLVPIEPINLPVEE